MDNILKLLLGVLGIAGLLAMLTPSQVSTPAVVEAAPANEVAAPVPETTDAVAEEAFPEEADDEFVKFGEPMIDGNPIIDDEAPQQQAANDINQPSPTGNSNGPVDYRQILDAAAQGGYGVVQPNLPAMTTATPIVDGAPAN